jgi:SAM-dependent methyltransferase
MGRATECMGSVTWAKTPERARATGPAPPATLRSMARPLPDPVLSRVADGLRHTGARVLCLAPPGELGLLASLYLGASDPSVRVQALLAGEPYLHGPLPGGLGILQGDPGAAEELEGPFDLIVGWASEPFVADFGPWLESLTRALRPGGHLQLDLPCAQFCPMLQACHPEAASWVLPEAEELRAALEELRLRDLELTTWVELRQYELLGDLIEELERPFPLHFEGRDGRRLLAQLRQNLVSAFEGAEELSLALRRVRVRATR